METVSQSGLPDNFSHDYMKHFWQEDYIGDVGFFSVCPSEDPGVALYPIMGHAKVDHLVEMISASFSHHHGTSLTWSLISNLGVRFVETTPHE